MLSNFKKMTEKSNTPGQKGGPNKPDNKPKFNTYWIIGIVLAALIGMQFLSNPSPMVETDSNQFFEMLQSGDIEKIVIVNKEKVEIYIKPERLSDAKYSEVSEKRSNSMLGQSLPQYYFTIVFPDVFGQELNQVLNEMPPENRPEYTTVTRKNVLGDMLLWILPFLLILGIWIYMLRRMSGGGPGGGGPGGASNIFNVGKSRAQIF